jgi:hypothetical protein
LAETVLIFPAGHPGGAEYRARAVAEGHRVIGASSLPYDPASAAYEDWARLPLINDQGFAEALKALIAQYDVSSIYTPHYVVWMHLSKELANIAAGVSLSGVSSLAETERSYRDLQAAFAPIRPLPFTPAMTPRAALPPLELAGLMRLTETISGMSSIEKMLAVIDIVACAPRGDIVEIGSWWGKSAAMFCLLAKRWDIGAVLCCDPWSVEALAQGDAVLDAASQTGDMDEALKIFQINLAPLADSRLNYLRDTSADGAARYRPGLVVETPTFGAVRYEGQISVLHIDGNHAFERVDEDARLWTPHVKPGGWIIFDDYFWVFGDGPRRVGDAYVRDNADRVQTCFTAGKALFVQLKA